jgi:PAS domain S-box-containing protein
MLSPDATDLSLPLLEAMPIGLTIYRLTDPADDASLTLIGFSTVATTMLRPDLAQFLGRRILDIFPETPREVIAGFARLARDGGSYDFGQGSYGDSVVPMTVFQARGIGLRDRTMALFFENVSELKRITGFLDAIVENLPNMIFVKDAKELRFERFNRAGEELLGIKRDQMIGKNDYDFFPAEQARFFQDRDRAALHGTAVVDIPEEPIQTANGQRWLHTRKVPIHDAAGVPQYLLGISEDITERKAADEHVKDLIDRLQATNAELDSFSYSVSHDLRAPLRAIDGFARVLVDEHGEKLGEEGRRVAGVITRNAVKMGKLIDELLAFSRLGRKQLEPQPVDMTALARAAAEEAREPGRTIEVRIGDLPPASGDPGLLEQVWVNLLSNAVKYSRPRDVAVIEVSGKLEDSETIYTVRDNGVGFDARYQAKLFGVFQRLHSESEYEGTGVGLALVKRIMQRHGGWIRAESVLGRGATFIFGMPRRQ